MHNGLVKQVNGGQEASEKEAGAVSPRTVKGAQPGGGRGLERGESLETSGTKYLRTQQTLHVSAEPMLLATKQQRPPGAGGGLPLPLPSGLSRPILQLL